MFNNFEFKKHPTSNTLKNYHTEIHNKTLGKNVKNRKINQ